MSAKENAPEIALPKGWNDNVKSAMLHVISLARFGMAYAHGWATIASWVKRVDEQGPTALVRLR